jgi:hypothetical protein
VGKKKKNKYLGPKRKRMNRSQRLQSAVEWMKKYEGKNIVKSYSKWYGVNTFCAMTELEKLGMKFSEKRKTQLCQGEVDRGSQKQLRKMRREALREVNYDSDETFAFIAGYTDGGFPFGITYEEMEEYERKESGNAVSITYDSYDPLVERVGDWFSETFEWEAYFGDFPLVKDQEQLIDALNKLESQLQIQKNSENK